MKETDNSEEILRTNFIQIIEEIARKPTFNDKDIKEYLEKFSKIYKTEFRHFYSDILGILLKIHKEKSLKESNVLEQLPANLGLLYEESCKRKNPYQQKLKKLYDHCLMDCMRMDYWQEQDILYGNITRDFSKLKLEKNKLEKAIEKTKKSSLEIKKDLISIVGIFLGIFLFIQTNFSQIKDLFEYDPYSRVLYVIIFNTIFLGAIYIIFLIIDVLIHEEPKILKMLNKISKKVYLIFIVIYFIVITICLLILKKDSGRKSLYELKNSVKNIEEEHKNYVQNLIKENDLKFKELYFELEKLKNENTNLKQNNEMLIKKVNNLSKTEIISEKK